jgi:hypothetical protein
MGMLQDSVACFHACDDKPGTQRLYDQELSCSCGPLLPLAWVQTLVIWMLTLGVLMWC